MQPTFQLLLRGKTWAKNPNRLHCLQTEANGKWSNEFVEVRFDLKNTLGVQNPNFLSSEAWKRLSNHFQIPQKKRQLSFTGLVATFQGKIGHNANHEMR